MSKNKINTNYFFVNRALLHSDRWLSEPFTRGQAWVDLFGLAQHSNGFFRVRGIKVNVERGQLAYSQVTLAKRWKWSRNKVRRYLKELENNKDVEQQNNEVTTTITILKYNDWQVSNTVSDTTNDTASDTTEGQQKDSKRNTYNKDKTVKTVKNDKKVLFPLQEIVEHYKHIKKYDTIPNWDKEHFARASASAKRILSQANNKEHAYRAITEIGKYCDNEGLSWTIETIVKKFPDWKLGTLKINKPQPAKEHIPDYLTHKLGDKI